MNKFSPEALRCGPENLKPTILNQTIVLTNPQINITNNYIQNTSMRTPGGNKNPVDILRNPKEAKITSSIINPESGLAKKNNNKKLSDILNPKANEPSLKLNNFCSQEANYYGKTLLKNNKPKGDNNNSPDKLGGEKIMGHYKSKSLLNDKEQFTHTEKLNTSVKKETSNDQKFNQFIRTVFRPEAKKISDLSDNSIHSQLEQSKILDNSRDNSIEKSKNKMALWNDSSRRLANKTNISVMTTNNNDSFISSEHRKQPIPNSLEKSFMREYRNVSPGNVREPNIIQIYKRSCSGANERENPDKPVYQPSSLPRKKISNRNNDFFNDLIAKKKGVNLNKTITMYSTMQTPSHTTGEQVNPSRNPAEKKKMIIDRSELHRQAYENSLALDTSSNSIRVVEEAINQGINDISIDQYKSRQRPLTTLFNKRPAPPSKHQESSGNKTFIETNIKGDDPKAGSKALDLKKKIMNNYFNEALIKSKASDVMQSKDTLEENEANYGSLNGSLIRDSENKNVYPTLINGMKKASVRGKSKSQQKNDKPNSSYIAEALPKIEKNVEKVNKGIGISNVLKNNNTNNEAFLEKLKKRKNERLSQNLSTSFCNSSVSPSVKKETISSQGELNREEEDGMKNFFSNSKAITSFDEKYIVESPDMKVDFETKFPNPNLSFKDFTIKKILGSAEVDLQIKNSIFSSEAARSLQAGKKSQIFIDLPSEEEPDLVNTICRASPHFNNETQSSEDAKEELGLQNSIDKGGKIINECGISFNCLKLSNPSNSIPPSIPQELSGFRRKAKSNKKEDSLELVLGILKNEKLNVEFPVIKLTEKELESKENLLEKLVDCEDHLIERRSLLAIGKEYEKLLSDYVNDSISNMRSIIKDSVSTKDSLRALWSLDDTKGNENKSSKRCFTFENSEEDHVFNALIPSSSKLFVVGDENNSSLSPPFKEPNIDFDQINLVPTPKNIIKEKPLLSQHQKFFQSNKPSMEKNIDIIYFSEEEID